MTSRSPTVAETKYKHYSTLQQYLYYQQWWYIDEMRYYMPCIYTSHWYIV